MGPRARHLQHRHGQRQRRQLGQLRWSFLSGAALHRPRDRRKLSNVSSKLRSRDFATVGPFVVASSSAPPPQPLHAALWLIMHMQFSFCVSTARARCAPKRRRGLRCAFGRLSQRACEDAGGHGARAGARTD